MGTYRNAYEMFAHRVQTAIALLQEKIPYWKSLEPKHLRVGIDMRAADAEGLALLLIDKGIFTREEYEQYMVESAEREALRYEAEVNKTYGADGRITLG